MGSAAVFLGGFLYGNVSPIIPFLLLLAVMPLTALATFFFIREPEIKEE
jgi:hypothetical protein